MALRDLAGCAEAVDRLEPEIDDDDVAQQVDHETCDFTDECKESIDEDEIVDEAEEWVFHASRSESDDNGDGEVLNKCSTSSDGTEWGTTAEMAERRPARNIMTERPTFRIGLWPHSRTEAFSVLSRKQ